MHLAKALQGWSKSALASEFEIDRRTIDKIIIDIPPDGLANGKPAYRMRDVAPAIGRYISGQGVFDSSDPEKLDPKSRKDWYDGEDKRLVVAVKKRELISTSEMSDSLVMVFDALKTFFVTLPDVLERDADLSAEQVELMIELCDRLLADFSEKLIANTEMS